MPVTKDASGRRWIQVEAEVPGTPEQVWKAIATGPGISAWFVPSKVEEREGVFSRYLPYAIAFNEADRWVKTFASVNAINPAAMGGWYVGYGPFTALYFASAVLKIWSFRSSRATGTFVGISTTLRP